MMYGTPGGIVEMFGGLVAYWCLAMGGRYSEYRGEVGGAGEETALRLRRAMGWRQADCDGHGRPAPTWSACSGWRVLGAMFQFARLVSFARAEENESRGEGRAGEFAEKGTHRRHISSSAFNRGKSKERLPPGLQVTKRVRLAGSLLGTGASSS